MKPMGLNEIRKKFLDFFKKNQHLIQPSYPLVPQNDKTLLLISAGMVPLKEFFTRQLTPPALRMATCQKCIRTNDIENVGVTSRHASFFEMLGNFSFGDYFKKEAIHLAWEFVTKELQIDRDKLWVTVYHEDDEAYNIWRNQENVDPLRIVKLGKEDNFWEIGTGIGPCGPCSELYYDRGETFGCGKTTCKPGCECDRFVEFWNLVFTQFEQTASGEYLPLENPNIDTGMGLERIACLMQDVDSIFDVDTMVTIRNEVVKLSGKSYGQNDKDDISIRKIIDHTRAITFLIADGVVPNNEGRGYVLRSLLRRAARHGRLLGINDLFLDSVAQKSIDIFSEAYPELLQRNDYIKKVIMTEESRFAQTIDQGLLILEDYIEIIVKAKQTTLQGELAFKLYDTYGFPLDLTKEILSEKGLTVDVDGFDYEMQEQRKRARSSREDERLGWSANDSGNMGALSNEFIGYQVNSGNTVITALQVDGNDVLHVSKGDKIIFTMKKTPFYAEGGGQVGDAGTVTKNGAKIKVNDTKKALAGAHLHYGTVIKGRFSVDDAVFAEVDLKNRMNTARNHTATHLLHQALKDVISDHVNQAGSLVKKDRLRFDFTHFSALSEDEIMQVETIVNERVLEALNVGAKEMPIEEAKALGAMSLFGEKYGDVVRVVSIDDYSMELCGGTHIKNTAEIGLFKIISETGVASGVRRIEAITGRAVKDLLIVLSHQQNEIAHLLKVSQDSIVQKIKALTEENKMLQKEFEKGKQQAANSAYDALMQNAKTINDILVVVGEFDNQQKDVLRNLGDRIIAGDTPTLAVLANIEATKVNFIAMANDIAVKKGVHCGNIARELAKICDGGGGGRANLAQAGGKDNKKLKLALQQLENLV